MFKALTYTPKGRLLISKFNKAYFIAVDPNSKTIKRIPAMDSAENTDITPIPNGIYAFVQNHYGEFALKSLSQFISGHAQLARFAFAGCDRSISGDVAILPIHPLLNVEQDKKICLDAHCNNQFVRCAGEIVLFDNEIIFWSLKSGSFRRNEADMSNVGLPPECYVSVKAFDYLYQQELMSALCLQDGAFKDKITLKRDKVLEAMINLKDSDELFHHEVRSFLRLTMQNIDSLDIDDFFDQSPSIVITKNKTASASNLLKTKGSLVQDQGDLIEDELLEQLKFLRLTKSSPKLIGGKRK